MIILMSIKGIAVQTILLLLVGILTVGVIIYAVYTLTSGSTMSELQCRGLIISWCTSCSNLGYPAGGPGMSDKLKDCAQKY
jgi:hypothetical protein